MKIKSVLLWGALAQFLSLALSCALSGCQGQAPAQKAGGKTQVVASDTLLSGMSASLLPPERFEVSVILPPGQCPGHYDLKLSDVAKVKTADLIVSFKGMPFMDGADVDAEAGKGKLLSVQSRGRNWMTPDAYIDGLEFLSGEFARRFPEHAAQIAERRKQAVREVAAGDEALGDRIRQAGIARMPIIASSMLREPLEWMGLRIAGEYDRPESISAKEIANLAAKGKTERVALIVDNLQSGPDAGKGIAEALDVPHVVLANFPMENGYIATLGDNVEAILAAVAPGAAITQTR
ncbi:MAG: zinc ABC transporter substrate-binding protein [Acidobacteriota bacterium]|jgi:zinc transport system substrate-binding protein|nr:zinc ABC transporter substrate-binding protein [Acidobacteriota bacterium]